MAVIDLAKSADANATFEIASMFGKLFDAPMTANQWWEWIEANRPVIDAWITRVFWNPSAFNQRIAAKDPYVVDNLLSSVFVKLGSGILENDFGNRLGLMAFCERSSSWCEGMMETIKKANDKGVR
jgi:hypothetical protein